MSLLLGQQPLWISMRKMMARYPRPQQLVPNRTTTTTTTTNMRRRSMIRRLDFTADRTTKAIPTTNRKSQDSWVAAVAATASSSSSFTNACLDPRIPPHSWAHYPQHHHLMLIRPFSSSASSQRYDYRRNNNNNRRKFRGDVHRHDDDDDDDDDWSRPRSRSRGGDRHRPEENVKRSTTFARSGRNKDSNPKFHQPNKNNNNNNNNNNKNKQNKTATTSTSSNHDDGTIRLNKWLANQGWCSRRQADDWLARGWIQVNGQDPYAVPPNDKATNDNATTTTNTTKVVGGPVWIRPDIDQVTVHPAARQQAAQQMANTILLHKPMGIVSGYFDDPKDKYNPNNDEDDDGNNVSRGGGGGGGGDSPDHPPYQPAVQLLTEERWYNPTTATTTTEKDKHEGADARRPYYYQHPNPYRQKGWKVAGRLDVNSTGLLVLTQSPIVAQQLVCPPSSQRKYDSNNSNNNEHGYLLEKEYLVRIPENVGDLHERIEKLRAGMHDTDRQTGRTDFLRAVSVEQIQSNQLRIILRAGKRHQIRRMLAAVQLPLRALKRVRIGNVVLGNLPVGKWRYLRPDEQFV